MSGSEGQPSGEQARALGPGAGGEAGQRNVKFFEGTDWRAFCLTAGTVLVVYLCTLAPEVTLEMSGMLATGAKYAGVAHPPGFPVWTLYAWLFTKLLPWSNIAWRVAVSSAVAGAVACGVVALVVSRAGAMILDAMPGFRRLGQREERLLRLVAGTIAGLGFGFSSPFWGMAVVADTRGLSIALFAITLCLLVRWSNEPVRLKYLYMAFLVYGLTVSASQVLIPAALGLPFFVMFGDRNLGRELFFAAAVLAEGVLVGNHLGWFPMLNGPAGELSAVGRLYLWIGLLCAAMCLGLVFKTGGILTRARPAVFAGMFTLVGTLPHLQLPLASMTNPPSDWGYARTVEGLVHVLTRGQYERLSPTDNFGRLLEQIWEYAQMAAHRFGIVYLIVAIIAFCFLRRMSPQGRGVLFGLLAFYLCTSALVLFLLNPPPDRAAWGLLELFFPASYLILAIWAGFGLILLGTLFSRHRNP